MTFFQRFLSLARADAHGLLDSLEDRSLVLRQCLREAELELARKRVRDEELAQWLGLLERQREQLDAREAALDEDVRLALAREQDDLARFSIRRLLAARRQRERLDEQARGASEERAKLRATLESQERELEELRDRVQERLARERTLDGAPPGDGADPAAGVRAEEVELELLRRRTAGAEGSA
jgi:phage shock protein A